MTFPTHKGSGFMQLKIEGPQGTVMQGQVLGNLGTLRRSWMPDVWRAAGEFFRRVVMARQFRAEGGYLGAGWAELSEPWLRYKRGHDPLEPIGQRTGAMIAALTGEVEPFTLAGPRGPVKAKPILKADANGVTIGADVTERGTEYTHFFDMARPIFGTGRLPSGLEFEFGKLLSLPFLVACKNEELPPDEVEWDFPKPEMTRYIAERALVGLT